MSATLRPMNLGEILDRTFEIYRKRFWVFVGLAALPAVAIIGIQLACVHWFHLGKLVSALNPDSQGWRLIVWLGLEHIAAFLGVLIMPAMVDIASKGLFGQAGTLRDSLRFALERWQTYLWIAILKLTAGMLLPELATGMLIGAEGLIDVTIGHGEISRGLGPILALGLPALVGFALFLWVGASLALTVPAAAIEGSGGIRALRRSWRLSRGTRLRILLTWAALVAFFWIANFVLEFLLGQLLFHLSGALHFEKLGPKLYQDAAFPMYLGVAAVLGSIYPIAITLFYYDQRIRREGYDIEKMMEAAGLGLAGAPGGEVASIEAEPQETEA